MEPGDCVCVSVQVWVCVNATALELKILSSCSDEEVPFNQGFNKLHALLNAVVFFNK